MCDPSHEQRLIDEYCGGEALLRKALSEHTAIRREIAIVDETVVGDAGVTSG